MDILNEYMVGIIVVICLCVGYVMKHWIKDVGNKWIPTIVAILGVVLSAWNNSWVFTIDVVAIGLVSGLASTGMYEMVTHWLENPLDSKE